MCAAADAAALGGGRVGYCIQTGASGIITLLTSSSSRLPYPTPYPPSVDHYADN
ncbi:hypothetical protein SNOG_02272 [Parastagonospora nodorum SN15]|uniref:Uncharacterized protein n=1 Tax=Phaeosphaeria nodorum (strain SN15 / ATCC MYA-4574 / FGSC 10173) TaxID=321614 RepID=Q0V142_PHANO|nr:hypothetical protein SNOG_02272 [Parastagonospora nodorum SN15]EAT90484.1 hypothetical protein SNOG_02272 [Parastagonospora nodorum SN15]